MSILWGPEFVYYTREPLAHAIAHLLYHLTGNHALGFALDGAICGALYLLLLLRISRNLRFLAPNLLTVGVLNFVGHIEYYAPVIVGMTFFFYLFWRAVEQEEGIGPVHVTAAFVLCYFLHKSMLLYAPIMFLWLIFARHGENGTFRAWTRRAWTRRPWPRRKWEISMILLIAMALLDAFPLWVYEGQLFGLEWLYIFANESFLDWITPLTPGIARALEARSTTGMYFLYSFGQPPHWMYFFGFVLMGAPLGWPLVIALRRRIRDDAARALLTSALFGVIWILFWHPRGRWLDWDLFSTAAIPVNLLAGGLWAGLFRQRATPSIPSPELAKA